MKKILVTGFDPFAHYQINPSWEAVRRLPDRIGDFLVSKLLLPNIYDLAGRMALEQAELLQPDVILLTGMDSGSSKLHIDMVAVNLRDALLEDNLGRKPWNEPVVPGGPAAYFATIPAHDLVRRLQAENVHVHLGYTVGGYVCNDVFYLVANRFAGTKVKVGFAHVPILPQMVLDDSLAMPLEKTIEDLERIISCLSALLAEPS